jgi:hypothetical protein
MNVYPHDGSKFIPFFPLVLLISPTNHFRKELQYILHSRHKAEIEILSSKQYEPISDISSAANPDLDNTYDGHDVSNGHTSPSYNPAPVLLDGLPSAHLVSSSSSSFKHGTQGTHMLLVRYLSMKVTNYVVSARSRSL